MTTKFLLDTSVVSETRKLGRANRGVRAWISSVQGDELCVSVLLFGEIRQGVERLRPRDPEQARVYDDWLAGLARVFEGRTLEITAEGCGRGTDADFARSLHVSAGSANELEYHLLLARDLGLLESSTHATLDAQVNDVKRMLATLTRRLKGSWD